MNLKSSLLFALFLSSSYFSLAQNNYAISTKGDTLKGELKFYSFDNLDRLQIKSKGKKSTYTALQIKTFIKDGDIYQPVKRENAIRFMRLIKPGYLSLFAFNSTGQITWDGKYLLKKDGTGMEVPNLSFKKLVAKYVIDCPELHNRIEVESFTRNDIERIVDLYNTCMQANTESLMPNSQSSSFINEKVGAITKLSEKVEAENFLTKKDVIDLLKDIKTKVSKNEVIPNYLTDGLTSYLADTPELLKEAEALVVLLKK